MKMNLFTINKYFELQEKFIKNTDIINSLSAFDNCSDDYDNYDNYPIYNRCRVLKYKDLYESNLIIYTNYETRLLDALQDYTNIDLDMYKRVNYFLPNQILEHIGDTEPGSVFILLEYSADIPFAPGLDDVINNILTKNPGIKNEIKNEAKKYLEARKTSETYEAFGYMLRINGLDYFFDLPGKNICIGLTDKKVFPETIESVSDNQYSNLSLLPAFLIGEILIKKEENYEKNKEDIKMLILSILMYLYGFEYSWQASDQFVYEDLRDPNIVSEYLKTIKKNTAVFTLLVKFNQISFYEGDGWNSYGGFKC